MLKGLVGLVVKAPFSRAGDPGLIPPFAVGVIPGRVIPVTYNDYNEEEKDMIMTS